MITPTLHAEQLAAEAGCRLTTARRYVMIAAFLLDGKSVDYAASALRLKPDTVRGYIKRFS